MAAASSDVWEVMSTVRTIRRFARNSRATDELHDRAGGFTSVLFAQKDAEPPARRPRTGSWRVPDQLGVLRRGTTVRDAVGVPDDWMLAGHIVVGWPKGRHGPVRRRPLAAAVNFDRWDQ
jgi:hypothetical protein